MNTDVESALTWRRIEELSRGRRNGIISLAIAVAGSDGVTVIGDWDGAAFLPDLGWSYSATAVALALARGIDVAGFGFVGVGLPREAGRITVMRGGAARDGRWPRYWRRDPQIPVDSTKRSGWTKALVWTLRNGGLSWAESWRLVGRRARRGGNISGNRRYAPERGPGGQGGCAYHAIGHWVVPLGREHHMLCRCTLQTCNILHAPDRGTAVDRGGAQVHVAATSPDPRAIARSGLQLASP